MEIGALGDDNFLLGFLLVGIRKTYLVERPEQLHEKASEALADKDLGILVIGTQDYEQLDQKMRLRCNESVQPTVLAVSVEGDTQLREKIKQAVGVDLWKEA